MPTLALLPRDFDIDDDDELTDVERGIGIAAIVGIVISIVGGIVVVILAIWLIRRRQKRTAAAVREAAMRGPVAPPNGYAAQPAAGQGYTAPPGYTSNNEMYGVTPK
jgi:hypothetical protein